MTGSFIVFNDQNGRLNGSDLTDSSTKESNFWLKRL